MTSKKNRVSKALGAVLVVFLLCSTSVSSACSSSFSRQLANEYGDAVTVVYAPTKSAATTEFSLLMVTEDGLALRVEVDDDCIYDSKGGVMDRESIEAGDTFDLYVSGGVEDGSLSNIEADALVYVSSGGRKAADEASAARASRASSSMTVVYTPADEEEYAADLADEARSARCVVFEEGDDDGDPGNVSVPDLAMYDENGSLMDFEDLQPGDVFVAYVSSIAETYPATYYCYRLELVERGGWDLVDDLADAWDYEF